MVDRATPNLPARDFGATVVFYTALGFEAAYEDPHWLILQRSTILLEFFLEPDVNPASTSASCCLRVDDVDAFYAVCLEAGLPETRIGVAACPRAARRGFRYAHRCPHRP